MYFDADQAHTISVLNASYSQGVDELGGTGLLQSIGQMVSSTLRPVGDWTLARWRLGGRQSGRPPYILEDQIPLLNSFALLVVDIPALGVSADPGSTPTASSHPGVLTKGNKVLHLPDDSEAIRWYMCGESSWHESKHTPSSLPGAGPFCSPSSFPIGFNHDHHHCGQLNGVICCFLACLWAHQGLLSPRCPCPRHHLPPALSIRQLF